MTMDDLQRLFPDMGTMRGENAEDGIVTYHNSATCPCHPDACRSLRITTRTREDGQVVALRLKCLAGCSPKEIVQKAGLDEARNIEKEGSGVLIAREDETAQQVVAEVGRASELLVALAEMIRTTNERITGMEARLAEMQKAVRTLEKVTPQQAGSINRAIRERAGELCEEYRMGADGEKLNALAAEIRKDVRKLAGVKATREVARCDYETVTDYVRDWEDYDRIQRIRKGERA